jgi:hypothetical protein
MTKYRISLDFQPITEGPYKGSVAHYNTSNKCWYIADSYTKGVTTVITALLKPNGVIKKLNTKETRYAKKAPSTPAVQETRPEFPKEV